jgi:glycosyltransferase involved in cell wall biosynthesis
MDPHADQDAFARPMRFALVHDWLTVPGGSEDVFREVCRLFPGTVFTSQCDLARLPFLKPLEVRTSYVQRLPYALKKHYLYAPLLAGVYRRFDFSEYDVILSDSHSFAHGVRKRPGALHVNYYHTPARSLWVPEIDPRAQGAIKGLIARRLKPLDLEASRNPDVIFANSQTTADRIERFYGRKVDHVIYPPVEVDKFLDVRRDSEEEGFLIWGRLIAYKRIDLAIDAARRMGFRLNIVGSGPLDRHLRQRAAGLEHVRFHGRLPDAELKALMARSKAVLFPCYEDFGIVPVEAMAAGLPVVAYGVGGAAESVAPHCGVQFGALTVDALCGAIEEVETRAFDSDALRERSKLFSAETFRQNYRSAVESAISRHFCQDR